MVIQLQCSVSKTELTCRIKNNAKTDNENVTLPVLINFFVFSVCLKIYFYPVVFLYETCEYKKQILI